MSKMSYTQLLLGQLQMLLLLRLMVMQHLLLLLLVDSCKGLSSPNSELISGLISKGGSTSNFPLLLLLRRPQDDEDDEGVGEGVVAS